MARRLSSTAGPTAFSSLRSQPKYGKDLRTAHAQARAEGLAGEHFDAFLGHFRDALSEVGVQPGKAEKVLKLLEAQRATVLNR